MGEHWRGEWNKMWKKVEEKFTFCESRRGEETPQKSGVLPNETEIVPIVSGIMRPTTAKRLALQPRGTMTITI